MDAYDQLEYALVRMQKLTLTELAKCADQLLDENWFLTQEGRDQVENDCAEAVYNSWMDTGACEDVGMNTYTTAVLNSVFDR